MFKKAGLKIFLVLITVIFLGWLIIPSMKRYSWEIAKRKEFNAMKNTIDWPFIYKGRLVDSFGNPVPDKTIELSVGFVDPHEHCTDCMGTYYDLANGKTDAEGLFSLTVNKDKFQMGMEQSLSIHIPPFGRGWKIEPKTIYINKRYEGLQIIQMSTAVLEGTVSAELLDTVLQNAMIDRGDIMVHIRRDDEPNSTDDHLIEKYQNGPQYVSSLGKDSRFKFYVPPDKYGLYLWVEPYHFRAEEFQSSPGLLKESILRDGYGNDISETNDIAWLNTALIKYDFYELYVRYIREQKVGAWDPKYEQNYADHKAELKNLTDAIARERFLLKSNRWVLEQIYGSCPRYKFSRWYRGKEFREIALAEKVPLLKKEQKRIQIDRVLE